MSQVFLVNQSIPSIGYNARTTTLGEEFDMVNRFLEHLISHYSQLKRKNALIFLEPQIETGYPDIVIAEYYSSPSHKSEIRNKVDVCDLKILFHIQREKNISITQISNDLGFSVKEVSRSVKRLSGCGLIHLSKSKTYIRNVRLSSYCTITRLISIEAKLDKWSEAIRQAENNTWFSTESYIMLNKDKCTDTIRTKCLENGIGIILVNGKIKTELKCIPNKFPISYASLQFNEWAYRYLNMRDEG